MQLEPPGLHLIYLPFQDDLRAPEAEPALVGLASSRADEAQIQAAEQLMERLHLTDFYCNNISNPVLVRHFDIIEVRYGRPAQIASKVLLLVSSKASISMLALLINNPLYWQMLWYVSSSTDCGQAVNW